MTRTPRYARTCALPAIAAALALSSTPLIAQQVQPTQPAPTTPTSPPPAADATPPTTPDTAPATTDTSTTVSTTQSVAPTATTTHRRTTTRTTHVSAKAAPAPVRTVTTKTVTTRTPAPATPPAAPTASNGQPAAAPVVDLTAKPANHPAAARPSNSTDETLPIAGGALALLVVGGAAYAISRRRRRADEEAWHGDWADEPEMAGEETMVTAPAAAARDEAFVHDEQPAIVAPPAFSWGRQPEATAPRDRDPDDDRLPGETWVERAHRGPSANNPSVSLKNRLRRAAFFDKRERDVAAGLAEPVSPDAGLPEAMTDQDERELA